MLRQTLMNRSCFRKYVKKKQQKSLALYPPIVVANYNPLKHVSNYLQLSTMHQFRQTTQRHRCWMLDGCLVACLVTNPHTPQCNPAPSPLQLVIHQGRPTCNARWCKFDCICILVLNKRKHTQTRACSKVHGEGSTHHPHQQQHHHQQHHHQQQPHLPRRRSRFYNTDLAISLLGDDDDEFLLSRFLGRRRWRGR